MFIDEIRISSTQRSADWIETTYNSMVNATDGGFFTLEPHETYSNVYVSGSMPAGWYNETNVHTIQEGIDNATVGGTIYVWDGTYNVENITVNKSVSIIGNSSSTVHLNWTDTGEYNAIMVLQSDNITISNIHFNGETTQWQLICDGNYYTNNTYVHNCNFTNGRVAFKINTPKTQSNINFSNNTVYNMTNYAIVLLSGCNISAHNNTIIGADGCWFIDTIEDGIFVNNNIQDIIDGDAFMTTDSSNITMYHNTINNH